VWTPLVYPAPGMRERGAEPAAASGDPAVSVVIPTRNRGETLARCLSALARSDLPRDRFEVVVVDDGGDASVEDVTARHGDGLRLRVVRLPWSGPARARNAGAEAARGRLLAFLDDDCEPEADWLEKLLAHHEREPEVAIGGGVANTFGDNPYSDASQALLEYLYGWLNPDPGDAHFFASLNLGVPREAFLAMKGFDPSYPLAAAEDRAFCRRWRAEGRHLIYAPEARVHHGHALGFRSFLRQHFHYGRGARRFHRQASRAGRRFEPWRFYTGLVVSPLRRGRPRALRTAALLLVSQLATLAGFGWEMLRPAPPRPGGS